MKNTKNNTYRNFWWLCLALFGRTHEKVKKNLKREWRREEDENLREGFVVASSDVCLFCVRENYNRKSVESELFIYVV